MVQTLKNVAKYSFASGIGFLGSFVVYMFVGMLLFIPGFILNRTELNKPKEQRIMWRQLAGLALMFMGAMFAFGMGFGEATSGLASMINS